MLKAIKIRLYPTEIQEDYINRLLGSCRFVYNNCLAYKIDKYQTNKESIGFDKLGKYVTALKRNSDYSWLKDSHSKVIQQSVIDLNTAFTNFFRGIKKGQKIGFPKFKAKHNKQSCRFPIDAIGSITGNRINIIQKLKNVHFKCSKRDEIFLNKYQASIRSATLSKTKSGQYYFSILIQRYFTEKFSESSNAVGIDLGIKDFVITSEGELFDNIKIKRSNQTKLNKLHKSLSRKTKGSNNRFKAKIKLASYYETLNNKKEHYLHQVANSLLNENQVIAVESLNVKGMMKNHRLARSIQELSLGRFINILKYKADWYGRQIVEIGKFFPSSKQCNNCGELKQDLSLKHREWTCESCGETHDRDLNAVKNILDEGLAILNKSKIGMSSPESTLLDSTTLVAGRKKKQLVLL